MIDRRNFAVRTAGALGALALAPADALSRQLTGLWSVRESAERVLAAREAAAAPSALAEDEKFWAEVRRGYRLHSSVLNLDHGWTNPAPQSAVDALLQGARQLEALPAEELPRMWDEISTTTVRIALAEAMGVPVAEIAMVRNATEALDTVLLGLPLERDDEIVCSAHDYFAMLDALEQRRARDGVVLRMIRPPIPAPSLDAIAQLYEAAIGPRTRLVLLTHPSNLTGQLLPVARIAAAAHRVGAEVVVDGAQSMGVLDDPVKSLQCDYYGMSAHKWLGTPVGMGVLWMRPEHTSKVWPLVPPPPGVTGMKRYEWIGTAPAYIEPAARPAIALHQTLGAQRKAARLRYLASHLRTRVGQTLPQARFYNTGEPGMSINLTTIELPGVDSDAVQRELRQRHSILVQSMAGNQRAPEIRGFRVSPNVYTTPSELDRFVTALAAVAESL